MNSSAPAIGPVTADAASQTAPAGPRADEPLPRIRLAAQPVPGLAAEVVIVGAGPAGVAAAEGVAAGAAAPGDATRAARRVGLRLVLVDDAPAGAGGWSGRLAIAALAEAGCRKLSWSQACEHVRSVRHDVVKRHQARIQDLQSRLGPQSLVLVGRAQLAGSGRVLVRPRGGDAAAGPHGVHARRIVLATGCVPALPEVTGLTETTYLTACMLDSLLDHDRPPATVAVLGAGSTGCALAQALARLGASVTLVDEHPQVLSGEDPAAASALAEALTRDGVRLLLGSPVAKVAPTLDGGAWLGTTAGADGAAERLILATGWRAATAGLDLAAAGVEVGPAGAIRVDSALVSSAHEVLAAGGVVAGAPHAGASLAMGAVAGANAVSRRPSATWSAAAVATLTLTDPEVASVGTGDPQAPGIRVGTVRWSEVDRAVLSGDADGFVRVLACADSAGGRWSYRRSGPPTLRVVGATVVGCRAGDLVAPLALAIGAGLPASALAAAVSADPTWSSALRLAVTRAGQG